jgi:class 3 adenylate cyclase
MQTKHLTIMFTDMKGFTSRTSVHTRDELEKLLDSQEEVIRPIFNRFNGKVVKTIGDAFMVVFESPTNAVLCGVKIQEELLNYNSRSTEEDRIEIRIGINSGEVNIKNDDYFGEPVNIASRIESIAEPNEVYFSDSVYLSMNKNEIPSAEVGIRHLKGIPDNIKVYRVLRDKNEIDKIKNNRKDLATKSNSFSKTGGVKELVETKTSSTIFKKILYFIIGAITIVFLAVAVMWIFKICPPAGPWMMPPWCK